MKKLTLIMALALIGFSGGAQTLIKTYQLQPVTNDFQDLPLATNVQQVLDWIDDNWHTDAGYATTNQLNAATNALNATLTAVIVTNAYTLSNDLYSVLSSNVSLMNTARAGMLADAVMGATKSTASTGMTLAGQTWTLIPFSSFTSIWTNFSSDSSIAEVSGNTVVIKQEGLYQVFGAASMTVTNDQSIHGKVYSSTGVTNTLFHLSGIPVSATGDTGSSRGFTYSYFPSNSILSYYVWADDTGNASQPVWIYDMQFGVRRLK